MREASVDSTHGRPGNRHKGSEQGAGSAVDLRERVVTAARRLAADGLVIGTAGNVSARERDVVAITPTGAALERLGPEQVAIVNLEGEQTGGELEPSSELALHLGVYRRYHAGGVVHTHAPMATALSCAIDELPVVHYQMLMLGGPVRVAPYATFGTPRARRGDGRGAPGPDRRADGQPRSDHVRARPRRSASRARCCSNGRAGCTGTRRRSAAPGRWTAHSARR